AVVAPDKIHMTDSDMRTERSIQPKDNVTVVIVRNYVVGSFKTNDPLQLAARRTRDAAGVATPGEKPRTVVGRVVNVGNEGRVVVPLFSAEGVEEGEYELGPAFLPGVPLE